MCELLARQPIERTRSETRSLRLNGQSTSIRLEAAFWTVIEELALRQGLSTAQLIAKLQAEILESGIEARNFTSALRCACLYHLQTRAAH